MTKLKKLTKEIFTDTGIGFITANIFLFATSTNALGFYSCIFALVIAVIIKTLSIKKLYFIDEESFIFDPRLTLWITCVVLMIVAVGSILHTYFLAALASCFFAISNFMIAESLSKSVEDEEEENSFSALLFKRPDLYLNIGTIMACLLAGAQAVFLIPLLIAALCISLRNDWLQMPEYYLHPKLLVALSSAISVSIGIFNKNFLVAIAHIIIAIIFISIEIRITNGGIEQILKDLKIRK